MSTGITVAAETDVEFDGYFQDLAMEFENINFLLKKEECDLSPFLHCPESFVEEETMKEWEYSEEQIADTKTITTDDYHPISLVISKIEKALGLIREYSNKQCNNCKNEIIQDLEELLESLLKHKDSELMIKLLRG